MSFVVIIAVMSRRSPMGEDGFSPSPIPRFYRFNSFLLNINHIFALVLVLVLISIVFQVLGLEGILAENGVDRTRLQTKAFGESQPKYPNDSEGNRSKNRRVELAIYANEDMVADAEAGTL